MYTLYLTSYRALLNTSNAFLLPSLMGLLWFASTSPSLWGSHPEDGSESPNFRLALPSYTNTNHFLAEHVFFHFLSQNSEHKGELINNLSSSREGSWVSLSLFPWHLSQVLQAATRSTTQIQMMQMYLRVPTNMFCLFLKPSDKHPEW